MTKLTSIRISLLILGLSPIIVNAQLVGQIGYGGNCIKDSLQESETCIISGHLICIENAGTAPAGICGCDVHMKYDLTRETCVVKAEERCLNGAFPTTCVANSTCVQNPEGNPDEGTCICSDEFIPNLVGDCKLGHYGSGCVQNSDCETQSFLKCESDESSFDFGLCVCEFGMIWNNNPISNRKECLSPHGGSCNFTGKSPPAKTCIPNAECNSDGICNCVANYIPTTIRSFPQCLLEVNQPCTAQPDCHPTFVCEAQQEGTSKVCACAAGKALQDNNLCITLADQLNCSNVNPCVPNSGCWVRSAASTCRCDTGYSASKDGICLLEYGRACSPLELCNDAKNLECADETCKCKTGYSYHIFSQNTNTGQCAGNIDQRCDPEAGEKECVSSYCNPSGKCACPSGSTPSDDLTECFADFGKPCSSSGAPEFRCSSAAHQECGRVSEGCRCEQNYISNGTGCVGKVATDCSEHSGCTENARCFTDSKCECLEGFSESKINFKCELNFGEGCDESKTCNSYTFLACSASRTCDCENGKDLMFDSNLNGCFLKAGATCQLRPDPELNSPYCMLNSSCISSGSKEFCRCNYGLVNDTEGGCVDMNPTTTPATATTADPNSATDYRPVPILICILLSFHSVISTFT